MKATHKKYHLNIYRLGILIFEKNRKLGKGKTT